MKYEIRENKTQKALISDIYNYVFNKTNGFFIRYGKTKDDDPDFCPFGPEIVDMEISTICRQGCKFCYKDNVNDGRNMSYETFVKIFNKLPKTVTQIAFGIGNIDTNPDLFRIMKYCRDNGVIPNVTINENKLDTSTARNLSMVCGAIAVSNTNSNNCYNTVETLNTIGMDQINIHQVISEENIDECYKLVDDCKTDERLKKLNAVVFLMLKPKGRGKDRKPIRNRDQYKKFIDYAIGKQVKIGFDSCSAFSFLKSVSNREKHEEYVDPCESGLFSLYINVDGLVSPCSFSEETEYKMNFDMLKIEDFVTDVWYNKEMIVWRNKLITNKKNEVNCLIYDLSLL